MLGIIDKALYWLISSMRGGARSLESIGADQDALLDLARSPQSGQLLMTGAEQTLYEESSTTPFEYNGGYIDWTGLNAGAGEDTTIKMYVKIKSGGTYRINYQETFLSAAVPNPPCCPIPRNADTDVCPLTLRNIYGIKITAQQTAIGAGWNTLDYEMYDSKRGG